MDIHPYLNHLQLLLRKRALYHFSVKSDNCMLISILNMNMRLVVFRLTFIVHSDKNTIKHTYNRHFSCLHNFI